MQHHTLTRGRYWLVTLAVMSATLMQFLDMTIANVAVPHMQASLNASPDTITWVLTSFIVSSAIAIPAAGWIAARFGTRLPFLVSLGAFILTSMLCGMAANLEEMVIFRALQGISATFITPISQTIMLDITPREKYTRALSMWGMTSMVGPIIGPTLGGFLTDNFDWRWVFFINAPLGVPAFLILLRYLPDCEGDRRSLDKLGYALLALALGSFQLMLDRGQTNDWFNSPETAIEAAVAGTSFFCFVVHTRFAAVPLFPREMITNPRVIASSALGAMLAWFMIGIAALLPTMFQRLFGYSVMQTGMIMGPRGLGICISMYFVPRLLERLPMRALYGAGFGLVGLTLHQMTTWTLMMPTSQFVLSAFVQGLGLGLLMMPINLLAFNAVSKAIQTDCSAFLNLVRNMSGSVAISTLILIFTRSQQTVHAELVAGASHFRARLASDDIIGAVANNPLAARIFDLQINQQAMMIAYLNAFMLLFILSIAAVGLGLSIKGKA